MELPNSTKAGGLLPTDLDYDRGFCPAMDRDRPDTDNFLESVHGFLYFKTVFPLSHLLYP